MSPQPVPAAPRPPLRVALAGIGVVGGGVVRLLEANRDLIARRAGRAVEIVAISARDRQKDRGVDLSPYRWEDDMAALVEADDVDVVVEMVGGADGPALTLARQAPVSYTHLDVYKRQGLDRNGDDEHDEENEHDVDQRRRVHFHHRFIIVPIPNSHSHETIPSFLGGPP